MFRKITSLIVMVSYLTTTLAQSAYAGGYSSPEISDIEGQLTRSTSLQDLETYYDASSEDFSEREQTPHAEENTLEVYSDAESEFLPSLASVTNLRTLDSPRPALILKASGASSGDVVIEIGADDEDTLPATKSQSDSPSVSESDSSNEEDPAATPSKKWTWKNAFKRGLQGIFVLGLTCMTEWGVHTLTEFVTAAELVPGTEVADPVYLFTDQQHFVFPIVTAVLDAPSTIIQYMNWFRSPKTASLGDAQERPRTKLQNVVHFLCPILFQKQSDIRKPGIAETFGRYGVTLVTALTTFSPIFQINQFFWETRNQVSAFNNISTYFISAALFVRNFENSYQSGMQLLHRIIDSQAAPKVIFTPDSEEYAIPKVSLWHKLTGKSEDPLLRRFLGSVSLLTGPLASFANYMIGRHVMTKSLNFLGYNTGSTLISVLPELSGIFSVIFRGGLETVATRKNFHNLYDHLTGNHPSANTHGKVWKMTRGVTEIFGFTFGTWEAAPMILLGYESLSGYPTWMIISALVPIAIGEGALQGNRNSVKYDQIFVL